MRRRIGASKRREKKNASPAQSRKRRKSLSAVPLLLTQRSTLRRFHAGSLLTGGAAPSAPTEVSPFGRPLGSEDRPARPPASHRPAGLCQKPSLAFFSVTAFKSMKLRLFITKVPPSVKSFPKSFSLRPAEMKTRLERGAQREYNRRKDHSGGPPEKRE